MSQLLKFLLFAPTVASSVLSLAVFVQPAHADAEKWVPVSENLACVRTFTREPKKLTCKRLNTQAESTPQVIDLEAEREKANYVDDRLPNGEFPDTFEMTDDESNAAVALFGCDCPTCVRAIRHLRSLSA